MNNQKSLCLFSMMDILTNKKHVSIKPVIIKGHHLYQVFCDLLPCLGTKGTLNLFPAEYCEFSLDYERNNLVCLVIKYNAFGNLLQKKRSVSPPPPIFFLMGVYKRLVYCQKLPPKSQFLAPKLGRGHLLEHGPLLEVLRYVVVFVGQFMYLRCFF